MLSVALSVELPRLGVTQHRALQSSDFPHTTSRGARSPSPLIHILARGMEHVNMAYGQHYLLSWKSHYGDEVVSGSRYP